MDGNLTGIEEVKKADINELLSTLLVIVLVYLISRKEEEELINEFGDKYEKYKKRVPMLQPRLQI